MSGLNEENRRPTYPGLIEQAARTHIEHLRVILADGKADDATRRAAEGLISSTEAALARGTRLTAADVPFSARLLAPLAPFQRAQLVNPATPGLGCDDAPVIVVGTEHAYDIEDDASIGALAVEGCALTILWLCSSRPDVLATIGSSARWVEQRKGPFHIHPNDYHRVLEWQSGNHTWKSLAKALAWAQGHSEWQSLLRDETGSLRLGDLTHQIELSALPSLRTSGGAPPPATRERYLREVVGELRATATVLVFHGAAYQQATEIRQRLARVFLGLANGALLETKREMVGRSTVWTRRGDRLVLFTQALNMAISNEYLRAVAAHLNPILASNQP